MRCHTPSVRCETVARWSADSRLTKSSNEVSIGFICNKREERLTKKAEPPPTRGVNRDSGTDSANGGWLRRLVRHQRRAILNKIRPINTLTNRKLRICSRHQTGAT